MFFLKLLGGAALEDDGTPVTGRPVHRRRLALLAVLAAARGRTVGRERLVGYLWPESPGDAARHLLSESLYILRKALGENAFVAAGDEVGLDPAVVASDVALFQDALEKDDPAAAAALYAGPFLDGFAVSDAPEFERWAEEERDRLGRAYARALEALAEAREAEGDPLGAAEWWKRLARHDPFSSRVALRVMRALETGGERAAAVRHAAVHAAMVRQELGVEPDAEVEALARRIREAPRPAPAAPAPPPAAAAAPAETRRAPAPEPAPAVPAAVVPAAADEDRPYAAEVERRAAGPSRWLQRPRHPRGLATVAMVGAIAIGLTLGLQRQSPAGEDSSVYIVLPFAEHGGGATFSPDQAELLLHDALSRWTDLQLVDAQRARDLLARYGVPKTLSEAREIARQAGAGRILWGEITPLGDSVAVRAGLYDLRRGGDAPEHTIRFGKDLGGASARMGELAAALLGREVNPAGDAEDAAGTTSLAAWQAYQRGRLAMARWDLEAAREQLARAVETDPGFAAAHLWLAQAIAWTGQSDPAEWRGDAARALADSARLAPRERALARALLALGSHRFPEACAAYDALVARDSADFAAWFGLGECHRRDWVVLPDPASPSGWRFRGSYHRAVQAYGRALRTVPSSHLAFRGAGFARLNELLQADPTLLRFGMSTGADTVRFAAYPSLAADTLAFVPWRAEDVAALRRETIPATRNAAVSRNRAVLRGVLLQWARAFPQSPDAYEALAAGLETMGEIRAVRQGQPSAFTALRQARMLARSPEQRLRLSVAQVRLYLRTGEWERARALADSALAGWADPGPREARALAPLAVLTGRAERARALVRAGVPEETFFTPQGQMVQVPAPLAEAWADALVYGSLGMARESEAAERQVERLIGTWIAPANRAAVRTALLGSPRRLGWGLGAARAWRAPLAEPDFVVEMQQLLARGDARAARERLAGVAQARGSRRPGDLTLDFVFPEAELRLALGDTAGAVEELDRTLAALEALPPTVLDRVDEAAGLTRAMRLRAAVASVRGDRRTAEA
ncbi:MAG TPA: BTAD domain-containing putative transcriptional regulator, partial [Longimicrobium sp.]